MAYDKGHEEFHTLDMNSGWQTPGYPSGFQERVFAGALDGKNKRGNRTRLLKIEPGTYTIKPFVHEYWEEVFLLTGDLIVGNDEQGRGGEQFCNFTYAVVRPAPITARSNRRPDAY